MKKLNIKTSRILRAIVLTLMVILAIGYAITGVNSKYLSTVNGSSNANVAKFNIGSNLETLTSTDLTVDLNFYDPAKISDTVEFNVTSQSEVSVEYDVIVSVPATASGENWLGAKIGDKTPSSVNESRNGNDEITAYVYTFSDVGTFTPNDTKTISNSLTLSILEDYQGDQSILGDVLDISFDITIHAEQID